MRMFLGAAVLVAAATLMTAMSAGSPAAVDDFESWIASETQVSVQRLNLNITAPGTRRGLILASPSQHDPIYTYYWVRDGAMVMRAILDRYEAGDREATSQLKDYVQFTRENQAAASVMPAGLGEPRFNTDGSVNQDPWARPQNDGPALRALTLIRYARLLLKSGDRASVERDLYLAEMPARSLIKTDLEFVAHHWKDSCMDLWEEVGGHHFFTQSAHMAALREGASLALEMNDPQAANFYSQTAQLIEAELVKHWDSSKGYYLSTLDFYASADHQKASQLDVSVLLAALFDEQATGVLNIAEDRIIQTAQALEATFASLYPINSTSGDLGTAIGRYPEDTYFGGHAWVLSTAAFAEWNYRLAIQIRAAKTFVLTSAQAKYLASVVNRASKSGQTDPRLSPNFDLASSKGMRMTVVNSLKNRGDSYLKRIRLSAGSTGHLSEQFDRASGLMLSARDLSWSYASFLRAAEARNELH